jgi:LTXXQ motif family protein
MLKIIAAGVTAFLVTASPLAHAQAPSPGVRLPATDLVTYTDMQINLVKAALQLTPEQEKYWPAIEDAIRAAAQNRQARIAAVGKRLAELRQNPIEILQTSDPVDALQRRADSLAQRSADLKKLADAWQPLYASLVPDQKKRMASLTLFVLREMSNAMQQRDLQCDEGE